MIAALRPIQAGNGLLAQAFICNCGHHDERHDDNPEDKHPKPAPQADRRFGSVRFMTGVRYHRVGLSEADRLFPAVMA